MGTQKPVIAIIVMLLAISSAYIFSDDIFDPDQVPSAPMELMAAAGIGTVFLDWESPESDGGSPIQEYRVYVSNVSESVLATGRLIGITLQTQFNCVNLTPGLTHYFLVTAVNEKGEGAIAQITAVPIDASGNLTVYFIDVGQGDSILIQTPDGKNILIDSGSDSAYSALDSFLQSKSITVIDVVVATHPDEDHIGGLDDVLLDYDVLSVYDSGFYKDTQIYERFRNYTDTEGCPYYNDTNIDPGILNWSSEVFFYLLHIDADAADANDASIVLKMSFGEVDFLLTGDAEEHVESWMLPLYDLDVEILKVGHHGSRTSSSLPFLTEVTPSVAIISVGEDNRYEHPHNETIDKLTDIGADIYRTDLNRTITITTDGTGWDILCWG